MIHTHGGVTVLTAAGWWLTRVTRCDTIAVISFMAPASDQKHGSDGDTGLQTPGASTQQ
jgi:hypothetical protein